MLRKLCSFRPLARSLSSLPLLKTRFHEDEVTCKLKLDRTPCRIRSRRTEFLSSFQAQLASELNKVCPESDLKLVVFDEEGRPLDPNTPLDTALKVRAALRCPCGVLPFSAFSRTAAACRSGPRASR